MLAPRAHTHPGSPAWAHDVTSGRGADLLVRTADSPHRGGVRRGRGGGGGTSHLGTGLFVEPYLPFPVSGTRAPPRPGCVESAEVPGGGRVGQRAQGARPVGWGRDVCVGSRKGRMLATDPLRAPSVQVPLASPVAAGPAARDVAGEARVGRVAPPPTSAQLALRAGQFPPFLSPSLPHPSPSFPSSPSSTRLPSFLCPLLPSGSELSQSLEGLAVGLRFIQPCSLPEAGETQHHLARRPFPASKTLNRETSVFARPD